MLLVRQVQRLSVGRCQHAEHFPLADIFWRRVSMGRQLLPARCDVDIFIVAKRLDASSCHLI